MKLSTSAWIAAWNCLPPISGKAAGLIAGRQLALPPSHAFRGVIIRRTRRIGGDHLTPNQKIRLRFIQPTLGGFVSLLLGGVEIGRVDKPKSTLELQPLDAGKIIERNTQQFPASALSSSISATATANPSRSLSAVEPRTGRLYNS